MIRAVDEQYPLDPYGNYGAAVGNIATTPQAGQAAGASETPFWMQRWGGTGMLPSYTYGQGGQGAVSWGDVSAPAAYGGKFDYAAERFNAPDGVTMLNDPGYQFRMKMGTDAIQGSAAARGTLLTGGTAKALAQYGQDYGSNEFQNVYNRALQGYQANEGNRYNAAALNQSGALQAWGQDANNQMQASMANAQGRMSAQNANLANAQFAYNAGLGNYDRQYQSFRTDQDNAFSRPFSLAQLGYNAAATSAGNYSNTAHNNANQLGNYWTQGANSQAAGQVGAGNAWANGLGNLGNLGMQAYMLSQYGNGTTGGSVTPSTLYGAYGSYGTPDMGFSGWQNPGYMPSNVYARF